MNRHIAFLRAINVGGHIVKMDVLRAHFEALKLHNVATFIASGNVIFDSKDEPSGLETKIEAKLRKSLGYDVATFLRTPAELAAITRYEPFEPGLLAGSSLYILLLKERPRPSVQKELVSLGGEVDHFHVQGREVHWLVRGKFLDSPFSGARLEKLIGAPATMRNVTTIRRLAAKYPA